MERLHCCQTPLPLLLTALWITTGEYGLPIRVLERFFSSQKAGHQEVEDGPQLEHCILYRCSREQQAMLGRYASNCFCCFRLGILNDVSFVQYFVVPSSRLEVFQVAREYFVRGDHKVSLLKVEPRSQDFSFSRRSQIHDNFIQRSFPKKSKRLQLPVSHNGGGTNYERRQLVVRRLQMESISRNNAQGHECLAQAHIIAQGTVKSIAVQKV
mmetsp:Transcript_11820/g.36054  ORF Transcript_11820/g.36054 Transcript_11820/m.36054 type:complete len:212 (-) Transcript_11820:491-1126(-)